MVHARDHGRCSVQQIRRAKRRTEQAGKILTFTRVGDLTAPELKKHSALQERAGRLSALLLSETTAAAKLIAEPKKSGALPHPMRSES